MLPCLRKSKEGTLIDLQVVPGSKTEAMAYDPESKRLKVRIKEAADKGKANKALIRKLAEVFGDCEITTGALSRKKTALIRGREPEEIEGLLK